MGVSRADERRRGSLADERGLPIAGVEFAAARTASFERQEPSLRRAARTLGAAAGRFDDEEEEEDEEKRKFPAARAPRKKAAPRGGAQNSEKFELPFGLGARRRPRRRTGSRSARSSWRPIRRALEGVLGDFGVRGEIIKANPGPVVTLYELEPAPGIKSSRVIGLADDIARSMSAVSARVAVVAGRNAIGIELPNPRARRSTCANC